ncbi:hypothetical protein NL676_020199 [Syzygium grande]|nr:hypothetical protein NL676_020199 [Syzygium grande]
MSYRFGFLFGATSRNLPASHGAKGLSADVDVGDPVFERTPLYCGISGKERSLRLLQCAWDKIESPKGSNLWYLPTNEGRPKRAGGKSRAQWGPVSSLVEMGSLVLSSSDPASESDLSHLAHRRLMLHNLAHVELSAIDLAWDTVVRFSPFFEFFETLGEGCFADFASVADDECRHFACCSQRLLELGFRSGEHLKFANFS